MNHREFIAAFAEVPLEISAGLPAESMRVGNVMNLRVGTVVGTGVPVGQAVHLYAGSARIGAGSLYRTGTRVRVRMVKVGAGR